MKLLSVLALSATAVVAAANTQLKQVNTIYILSMTAGMDQYLANQLTSMAIFQVVTDPQKADAVITDHLGELFESKLKELNPGGPSKTANGNNANNNDNGGPARVSSLGRGRGNFFIVDRRSGAVLWSIYEEPKDSTPAELTKIARKIGLKLKNDLTDKKQTSE
jgi:hypothetical protein